MKISPVAGTLAKPSQLIDVDKLVNAYYSEKPNPGIAEQKVSFGTSGHRGCSLKTSFNENHIIATTAAICLYRKQQKITGPLFLGIDTHALSVPAFKTAVEVLVSSQVDLMLAPDGEYTPTPAVSRAILVHNKTRKENFADGIVITPSHNPPQDGGFKYNPPHGGPAGSEVTSWIESKANEILQNNLSSINRTPFEKAIQSPLIKRYNFLSAYVNDLEHVIDMQAIASSNIKLGVDPLGGAGVHYWREIKKRYNLNLSIISEDVDPTFSFMPRDWDGQIRMDPSSSYAMQSLIHLKDRFDVAFACDTDHDRHGIVTKSFGLLPTNHYLSAAIFYLFNHRPGWRGDARIGKTVVTSQMVDRIARHLNRRIYEVPVGFKWFVDGLLDGSLAFGCEESAGASFACLDGSVWTTDKDGIILGLLAAEMTAKTGNDPGMIYQKITKEFGEPFFDRVEGIVNSKQKEALKKLSKEQIQSKELAGETIESIITTAPGNNAPIGGVKVIAKNGWFAARPSGTEDIYKLYAESFKGKKHLELILEQAGKIVDQALAT